MEERLMRVKWDGLDKKYLVDSEPTVRRKLSTFLLVTNAVFRSLTVLLLFCYSDREEQKEVQINSLCDEQQNSWKKPSTKSMRISDWNKKRWMASGS
jgi:hypothetical protein